MGPENLIIQPTGETQTQTGKMIEREWANRLIPLGYYMVDNGEPDRSKAEKAWSSGTVLHPNKLSASKTANQKYWINNDTAVAIIEASIDGTMTGKCNPDKIRKYILDGETSNRRATMVYAWGFSAVDGIDIEAIGCLDEN